MSWTPTMDLRFEERKVLPPGFSVAKTERFLQQRYVWRIVHPLSMADDLLPQHTREQWRDVPLMVDDSEPGKACE